MPSDLIWSLLKSNNCFVVKRNGVQFSRESNNLTNQNRPRFSGLVGSKTVAIQQNGKKVTLTLETKKTGSNKSYNVTESAGAKVSNLVKSYNAPLAKAANARFRQVSKAANRKAGAVATGPKTRRTFKKN